MKRLVAVVRDPETPRWCKLAVAIGMMIAGPVDEVVIYPVVAAYMYTRRRHVLIRHGVTGRYALVAATVSFAVLAGLGFAVDLGLQQAGLGL